MTALGWPGQAQPSRLKLTSYLARAGGEVALILRGIGSAPSLNRATWIVSISGAVIIALLSLRVWLQLTGETDADGLLGLAYGLSGVLASPFRSFEPTTPIKDNGILEFSSLVAIEAYLIATLIALTVLFSARLALMAAPRVVHHRRPAFGSNEPKPLILPDRPRL